MLIGMRTEDMNPETRTNLSMSSGQRKSRVKQRLKVNVVENPRVMNQRTTPRLLLRKSEEEKLKQGLALRKAKIQIHVLSRRLERALLEKHQKILSLHRMRRKML